MYSCHQAGYQGQWASCISDDFNVETYIEDPGSPLIEQKTSARDWMLKWFCGVDKLQPKQSTADEIRQRMEELTQLQEDKKWKPFLDTNCIICLFVAVFLHAFFY